SLLFFFSSRRRHTRSKRDWSSDVCSSDLFAVDTMDVARFVLTALLIGVYVALWLERRGAVASGWQTGAERAGGAVGACVSVLGRSEERRVGTGRGGRGAGARAKSRIGAA